MPFLLDGLAVFGLVLGLQTLGEWQRHWGEFWDEQVSKNDQQLALKLAIFGLVPLGVLLHEVGHCLAIWQAGGEVASFQWRYFWGFVIPRGHFTPVQAWWIALSGNVVSLLLVLLALLGIPKVRKRIVAELLMGFAICQAVLVLVSYPLFSLGTRWGDWVTIYDFSLQPQSTLTLLVHGLLLVVLWCLYHSERALHWRLGRTPATAHQWRELKQATDQEPNALADRLALVDLLLREGEQREAKRVMGGFRGDAAADGRVWLRRAALAASLQAHRRAIRLGESLRSEDLSPEERQRLAHLLTTCHGRLGQPPAALGQGNHQLEPRRRRFSAAQRLVFGLGCLPVMGLPIALGGLLWGGIRWRRGGWRWIVLAVAAVVMNALLSVLFLVSLALWMPVLFRLLPKNENSQQALNEAQLVSAAALIESYRAQKGSYPANLRELSSSMGYSLLFDGTMPPPAPAFNTMYQERQLYVYQRSRDGTGYGLFGRGPDGKIQTPDDVWPKKSASLPGLRPPPAAKPLNVEDGR